VTAGLTIDDLARFLGHAVWLERRLFEVVGGWVRSTEDPAVKLELAREARRHGAHVELLEPLRPNSRDHDTETASPLNPAWRSAVARLLAATTTGARLERLAETLRAAVAGYEDLLPAMQPVRDAGYRRALLAVLDDERAALDELDRLGRRFA
jgi:sigma54-dependent transcription regulator